MWIELSNVDAKIIRAEAKEQDWLGRYLSFEDAGFRRKGKRISLLDVIHNRFPAGMYEMVAKAARKAGFSVDMFDKRTKRIVEDIDADLGWLRDYQVEAVNAVARQHRGIVKCPTGSGKTEIAVGLVKLLPGRWLFLVHRDNLVEQAAKRYEKRTGLKAHNLTRTSPSGWKLQVGLNVCTFQTIAAAMRANRNIAKAMLIEVDGLIIDECHVLPADTFYDIVQQTKRAYYRVGLSGTPLDRTDRRSLMAIAALGPVVYSIKPQLLIDRGVLAQPTVNMVPCRQIDSAKGSYAENYEAMIAESGLRNLMVCEIVRTAPKPTMVFVQQIDHGKLLKRELESAGLNGVEFVWGNTKSPVREAAIKRLEYGDSEVLIASVVFQEGVDIPSLASVVVASGGKSIIAALQRIGRGMRTDEGRKLEFVVFDFLDLGSSTLEKHSRKRMNTYVRENYPTYIRDSSGTAKKYEPKLKTRREKRRGI